jgi:hypothetical protein
MTNKKCRHHKLPAFFLFSFWTLSHFNFGFIENAKSLLLKGFKLFCRSMLNTISYNFPQNYTGSY